MKKVLSVAAALVLLVPLANAEVAVIAHPSVSESASSEDLSRVFLGKRKALESGYKVIPLNLKEGSTARDEFNDKVLGKSESQLKSYWSKLIFTGKGQPPKEMDSESELVELIKSNPNMIGYVNAASIPEGVSVLGKF